ncbi:MAG: ribose-5-phosphate isomerase RpiA [Chlamydiota bacterium]
MNGAAIKKAVGLFAAQLVPPHIIVGLGTGSTASCFIEALAERVRVEKLPIKGVATSQKSHSLATSLGIQMVNNEDVTYTDLTIDGADEIDPQKCLIKGGGGALVREKILATISHEMIVLVDESKLVKKLGNFGLPVEILPFCYHATMQKIASYDFKISLRKGFISDNGNFIVDLHGNFDDLINTEKQLSAIPGVVDTGLFIGIAGRVIIGRADGTVSILK